MRQAAAKTNDGCAVQDAAERSLRTNNVMNNKKKIRSLYIRLSQAERLDQHKTKIGSELWEKNRQLKEENEGLKKLVNEMKACDKHNDGMATNQRVEILQIRKMLKERDERIKELQNRNEKLEGIVHSLNAQMTGVPLVGNDPHPGAKDCVIFYEEPATFHKKVHELVMMCLRHKPGSHEVIHKAFLTMIEEGIGDLIEEGLSGAFVSPLREQYNRAISELRAVKIRYSEELDKHIATCRQLDCRNDQLTEANAKTEEALRQKSHYHKLWEQAAKEMENCSKGHAIRSQLPVGEMDIEFYKRQHKSYDDTIDNLRERNNDLNRQVMELQHRVTNVKISEMTGGSPPLPDPFITTFYGRIEDHISETCVRSKGTRKAVQDAFLDCISIRKCEIINGKNSETEILKKAVEVARKELADARKAWNEHQTRFVDEGTRLRLRIKELESDKASPVSSSPCNIEKVGAQVLSITSPFSEELANIMVQTFNMLVEKNTSYGNSALEPARIFSKCDNLEGIRVRIDDKLNRIMKGKEYPGDNDVDDLLGYLNLYKVGLSMSAKLQREKNLS